MTREDQNTLSLQFCPGCHAVFPVGGTHRCPGYEFLPVAAPSPAAEAGACDHSYRTRCVKCGQAPGAAPQTDQWSRCPGCVHGGAHDPSWTGCPGPAPSQPEATACRRCHGRGWWEPASDIGNRIKCGACGGTGRAPGGSGRGEEGRDGR